MSDAHFSICSLVKSEIVGQSLFPIQATSAVVFFLVHVPFISIILTYSHIFSHILTYSHIFSHILTYSHIFSHILGSFRSPSNFFKTGCNSAGRPPIFWLIFSMRSSSSDWSLHRPYGRYYLVAPINRFLKWPLSFFFRGFMTSSNRSTSYLHGRAW